jgi:hypothetical protein
VKRDFAHVHTERKPAEYDVVAAVTRVQRSRRRRPDVQVLTVRGTVPPLLATLHGSMRHVHRPGEKQFVDYAGQTIGYGRRRLDITRFG